jgi:N,N'-diacetyllegionaminate synthase
MEIKKPNMRAVSTSMEGAFLRMDQPCFIIAEAGVNHNGDRDIARQLVAVAKYAGADAVKFQTFKAEKMVSRFAPKAEYQKGSFEEESQLKMLQKLELGKTVYEDLIHQCKGEKIIFLSSPFDLESIDLLDAFGLQIFKIPSGEINNLPYLRRIGRLRKKLILSTGMSDLNEIGDALNILITSGTRKEDITVLHCNSEYPTPLEDVNLLAMLTIKSTFHVVVGYSDHTPGIDIPIAAVSLGASVIEKHITLDRNMDGPDHKMSLEPEEFRRMVAGIRNIEKALGNGIKRSSVSEGRNRRIVRKSIIAARHIRKGEVLTEENMTTKRPATGIDPMEWDRVIGKIAKRDFAEDDFIEL